MSALRKPVDVARHLNPMPADPSPDEGGLVRASRRAAEEAVRERDREIAAWLLRVREGAGMWWACAVAEMDAQSGQSTSTPGVQPELGRSGGMMGKASPRANAGEPMGHMDSGGASRFFPCFSYQAKAAGGERHAGCDDLYWRSNPQSPFGFDRLTRAEYDSIESDGHDTIRTNRRDDQQPPRMRGNVHPTVKSIALMERLVALVTPPGGRLGDVTLGSPPSPR